MTSKKDTIIPVSYPLWLRAGVGAFFTYITAVKEQKVVCSAGNRFIVNTIILSGSAKRKCKRIDFKRFLDQAFLVCNGS